MMELHEEICTLNPERVCRWLGDDHAKVDLARLVAHLRLVVANESDPHRQTGHLNDEDIEWLRGEVDGCPACMLAALRQSGLDYHYDGRGDNLWDYQEEVKRFREEERRAEDESDWRAIQGGWA